MFHLASSLYTQYTKREQYNILILGLDNAGKTTFLEHIKLLYSQANDKSDINKQQQRHKQQQQSDTPTLLKTKRIAPTVGQNTTTIKYHSENQEYNHINLKFWDLGGQKSLRSMWSRYYSSCHGIIFIIDSTDAERFEECYETLVELTHDSNWGDSDMVSVPMLMMANKQDLPQAIDLVTLKTGVFIQLVSDLEATDLKLLPVSVLENQGLKESLEWLVTRLVYNKEQRGPEYK